MSFCGPPVQVNANVSWCKAKKSANRPPNIGAIAAAPLLTAVLGGGCSIAWIMQAGRPSTNLACKKPPDSLLLQKRVAGLVTIRPSCSSSA